MSKSSPLLYILGIPALFLAGIVIIWNPNWFKSDIEQQLETVQEVTVKFEELEHSLLSPGELAVNNIKLTGELISGDIDSLRVKTQVNPLISKSVIIDEIVLVNPTLQLDIQKLQQMPPAEEGESESIEKPAGENAEPLPIKRLQVKSLSIQNATIVDTSADKLVNISGLDITISNINLVENNLMISPADLAPIALALTTNSAQVMGQELSKISINLHGNGKQIVLDRLQANTANSQLDVSGIIDTPMATPTLNLNVKDSRVTLDDFAVFFKDYPILPSGSVNLNGVLENLSLQGGPQEMFKALNGDLQLGLSQGKLKGIDVNQIISAIKESREMDIKDIGGFLLTGPIGILATQFIDLGSGSFAMSGETQIPQLQFNSKIDQGVLNLQDTAFATDEYRMALAGGVDLAKNQFRDFTFSILNKEGCADIQQTLNGDIDNPKSAVANTLVETIISPLKGLFKNVVNQVDKCEPVYEGNVKHPQKSNN